ncbi:MAG TPA: hypothetical protein VFQ60_02540 [Patescibacteria group bacterium]|nr:hypothetical protein [Patescibacteria group bacterium]
MKKQDQPRTKERNYLVSAFGSILIVLMVKGFWPTLIPFGAFEFWKPKGSIADWFNSGWPLLLWAVILNSAVLAYRRIRKTEKYFQMVCTSSRLRKIFLGGLILSTWAGVMEEICFRWLIFLGAIVVVRITNICTFGLAAWFHLHALGPGVDFLSLGYLHSYLFHTAGWAVGAALISSNAFFREGHTYQGLVGVINSWLIGFFLFWIMFTYGLLAAILLHFLYDFVCDLMAVSFIAMVRR